MSSELRKIHLKPTKTLAVGEGRATIQLVNPNGESFVIGNKNGDVTVYENLEPRHRLSVGWLPMGLFSFAIHPSRKLFAAAQPGAEKQPASVSLYDIEREIFHFHPPITSEGFSCPAVGYDEQGNFFLATETEGAMALYAWDKSQPVTDYADLSRAAAFHRFEYSWTGVMFMTSYQPGLSLLGLMCGHGGTTDYHFFKYKAGQLFMEAPVSDLSLGVAFSPGRSELIASWWNAGESAGSQKYNLNKPLAATTRSPIKFEKIGEPLPWPSFDPDEDDQDCPCYEFFYLDSVWGVLPSEFGRIYVVDTRTMTLTGELVVEGCPQPRNVTRCGDYLLISSESWSFVKIDDITQALGKLPA